MSWVLGGLVRKRKECSDCSNWNQDRKAPSKKPRDGCFCKVLERFTYRGSYCGNHSN